MYLLDCSPDNSHDKITATCPFCINIMQSTCSMNLNFICKNNCSSLYYIECWWTLSTNLKDFSILDSIYLNNSEIFLTTNLNINQFNLPLNFSTHNLTLLNNQNIQNTLEILNLFK